MNNLTVAFLSFFFLAALVVFAARQGEKWLFALSVNFILLSNITVQIPVTIVLNATISWAIIIYSLVYLITDIIIEYYGRKTAVALATLNLISQLILWAYVWLSLQVVPSESGRAVYDMMEKLFGTTTQITWAAVVASLGPFLDIYTTDKIRHWIQGHLSKLTRNDLVAFLGRTKLSTIIGEIVNTVIFFSIAFYGSGTGRSALLSIIVTASLAKIAISLLDIPFLILVRRHFPPRDFALKT